jgi:hypothetical protein
MKQIRINEKRQKPTISAPLEAWEMILTFERIFSDQEFEVWKIGLWEFTRTSDGEAFWEWTGPVKSEQYQESNCTSHRARGPAKERVAEAKSVPEAPAPHTFRRTKVSLL